jgi:transcription-repair coupling factor (superfamily II helicase)
MILHLWVLMDHAVLSIENVIERELNRGVRQFQIEGSSGPTSAALVLALCSPPSLSLMPRLVVTPDERWQNLFLQALEAFEHKFVVHCFEAFDVTPYSGLETTPRTSSKRIGFLHHLQNAKPGDLFVTPVAALMQKTIPFNILKKHTLKFNPGYEIPNARDLFHELGYIASPYVEDIGQYSIRGGIVDVFSPAHQTPVRIELFGDSIESLRTFSPESQSSIESIDELFLTPARECFWKEIQVQELAHSLRNANKNQDLPAGVLEETLRSIGQETLFPGFDFLVPFIFSGSQAPVTALDHLNTDAAIFFCDKSLATIEADKLVLEYKAGYAAAGASVIRPEPSAALADLDTITKSSNGVVFDWTPLVENLFDTESTKSLSNKCSLSFVSTEVTEFINSIGAMTVGSEVWKKYVGEKISSWQEQGYQVTVFCRNQTSEERLRLLFRETSISLESSVPHFSLNPFRSKKVMFVSSFLPEPLRIKEDFLVFLRDEDFLGKKTRSVSRSSVEAFQEKARRMSFGDLKPGDFVVHVQHGVGIYDGLKVMSIGGVDSEFLQIQYKDKDRLYLPVYRLGQLQKYAGSGSGALVDKLGGVGWEKTKIKVRAHLKDIALDLLQLYARRKQLHRPPLRFNDADCTAFNNTFPYDETEDQLRSLADIQRDLSSDRPMDRLICGDVGFGKTEIAMRAAFMALSSGKQVAVIAPTTVLTFQHFETFKERFKGWHFEIAVLNRFITPSEVKKTLQRLREGQVRLIIGTHRLLSQDVSFKDLGMLIVDEEQKFGVIHKEKIRKLRTEVDTLALSATPIPRTLNMSLMGIRDLSLINTAPVDRLPTRTYISKWDNELIRRACESEIERGGQIYFINNRIQSIYSLADELRALLPAARIKVGHGQMPEHELEKTMTDFFHHEIDILICTAIVESGMDVPRANTMFIHHPELMGLSQLYQLRGRVGRSKVRAYCYLLLPRGKSLDKSALERLKVIQENTALGSGIKIAQYDLELRGAGDLLGEDQSGHINAVGYELYMDLLNQAVSEARGETLVEAVDPEINLRIPALIPDSYISDIRIRLSFYKALTDIQSEGDLEKVEAELVDQFGPPPDQVQNLMGLMLIRSQCKRLGIKDISAGLKSVSLVFSDQTPLKAETAIRLASKENKKYSLTPDQRLNIRINNQSWTAVFEELNYLISLI